MTHGTEARRYWRTPLDKDRVAVRHGSIHILEERCKGCAYCVEHCPLDVLRLSTRFNLKGYHPPEVAREETCVACHLCEVLCPEFAIFVTDGTEGETGRPPIPENLPDGEGIS
ncbi:MAG: ferredoxin family protein [Candidatus Eisenbacteria bacterium]|nr:ferredoxin family protein [Candidatus Eisenbacteria bacterium]